MLTVTPDVFRAFGHLLDLAEPAPRSVSHSGVLIPSQEACNLSNSEKAREAFKCYLSRIAGADVFLFSLQSAWQNDTPRIRLLGLKPDLANFERLECGIAAQKMIRNVEGKIRFCGLVRVGSESIDEALSYLANHQRHSLLIIRVQSGGDPDVELENIASVGLNFHLKSKKTPYLDWVRIAEQAMCKNRFFVTAVGWNERHGDLRYLVLGDAESLDQSVGHADNKS